MNYVLKSKYYSILINITNISTNLAKQTHSIAEKVEADVNKLVIVLKRKVPAATTIIDMHVPKIDKQTIPPKFA